MSEPNGRATGGTDFLDRIERELNVMRDHHVQFREEYKRLLSALAQTQRGLEELRKNLA